MNKKDIISSLREDYKVGKLIMSALKDNPIEQFNIWLEEALKTNTPEPTAMNLATCSSTGALSSRMVLLKEVDERGFVFYTNYESRKAQDIDSEAKAALCFWWGVLERQVRVEGSVELVSANESDEYFASRPRGSQIGAIASKQSSVIHAYQDLRDQVSAVEELHKDSESIPRPDYWGGYRVIPEVIEFWQGQPNRLHDRLRYIKETNGDWKIERLSP